MCRNLVLKLRKASARERMQRHGSRPVYSPSSIEFRVWGVGFRAWDSPSAPKGGIVPILWTFPSMSPCFLRKP